MGNTDNSTLCSAFWNHTNIRSDNRIFPCCRFKNPIQQFNGDVSQILFSEEYEVLRSKSLAGIPIADCSKCYLEEKLGKQSLRQEFNSEYNTDEVKLKYLEIGFDNICNLACDGCWGEWSSTWAKLEGRKNIVITTEEFKNTPEGIEKVLFLGGEPLMTTRHRKFLKTLVDKNNILVTYYTNGTFLLQDADIELLKLFKKTKFIVSIDGVAELNDKVRKGSVWMEILKFLDQLISLNFELSIHSVIHKNNWHGFSDLKQFVEKYKIEWTIGLLTYPEKMCISTISEDDKRVLISNLLNDPIPNNEYILGFLKNENS
jgi:sulfatase maturation enzyme AslB (radical SAM superfamily)